MCNFILIVVLVLMTIILSVSVLAYTCLSLLVHHFEPSLIRPILDVVTHIAQVMESSPLRDETIYGHLMLLQRALTALHHYDHLPVYQQFGRGQVRRMLKDECLGSFKSISMYLKTLQQQRQEEPKATLQPWSRGPQSPNSTLSILGSTIMQTVFDPPSSTATTGESPVSTFVGTLLNMPISFNNVANKTGPTITSTEQHSVLPGSRRRR